MKGAEKKPNGEKTPLGKALSAWGFGSKAAAKSFANRHKRKA
jgi:hypothetical protein